MLFHTGKICTERAQDTQELALLFPLRSRVRDFCPVVGGNLCFPLSAYDWPVWPITRPHFFKLY